MRNFISEDDIEQAILSKLKAEPFEYDILICDADPSKRDDLNDGTGRNSKKECVLPDVMLSSLKRINPTIEEDKIKEIQSNKILKELRKIKYLELDAPVELIKDALLEEQANYWNAKFPLLIDDSGITHKAKSALISWFEENIPMSFNEDSDIEAELEKYYSASLKTYKDTFLRCMRSYQDASSIDLGLIDNAYGNLDFIISNHSIRKYAYNNIFDKMRKFVYQFREEAYHFDLLNDGKGNFAVCVSKVVDLNKLFFAAKDVKAHGYVNTLVYQTAFDEIESELEKFRCKIYKTKYVPVKSSPISGMMRYFGEDSETKGTDE